MSSQNINVKVNLDRSVVDDLARLSVETGLSRSSLIRLFVVKATQSHKNAPEHGKEFSLDDYLD